MIRHLSSSIAPLWGNQKTTNSAMYANNVGAEPPARDAGRAHIQFAIKSVLVQVCHPGLPHFNDCIIVNTLDKL